MDTAALTVMTMDRFPVAYLAHGLLKAIEKDNDHKYVLQQDLAFRGVSTKHFQPFDYSDDILEFRKVSADKFDLVLKAGGDIYDGTSMLPDKGTKTLNALLKAHFVHDAIYEQSTKISNATGVPIKALLAFADDCLKLTADFFGASKPVTSAIHGVLRTFGSLYHKIHGLIFVVLLSVLVAGCYSIQTTIDEFPADVEYVGPLPQ